MAIKLKSTALRYGLPIVSFALIILAALALRYYQVNFDLIPLFIIVLIGSAWYGGRGPGLLIVVTYELTLLYFTPPTAVTSKLVFLTINRLLLFLSLVFFVSSRRSAQNRLREQSERLQVSLSSIGDAVIATDINGIVNFMNPTAEALTGWPLAEARNRRLSEVFQIVDERTGQAVENPVSRVLREDRVVGLSAHTLLLTRDGKRLPIDDSSAPIRSADGVISGVILTFRDMSEHQLAERALHVAQEQLQLVTDTMAVAVARCSRDMRYLWVSQGYSQWVQRPVEEIAGRTITEVIGHRAYETIRPFIDRVLRGERVEYESPVNIQGRGVRWVSGIYTPTYDSTQTPDGWVAVILDITAQKDLENAVRVSEERFRLAAEAVNGIIYDVDYVSNRVERTRGLFEVLGYHPEAVSATNDWWLEQMHPEDRMRIGEAYEMILASERLEFQYDYRLRHKDGHWVHLMDRAVITRDGHGRALRQVGCALDITQIREAEQALKDADRRKDEFLAMLAHELRNPLAPIANAVQLLRRLDTTEPEIGRLRSVIERQTELLTRLVDDLLDVARITQGRIALRKEPIELQQIVARAVETSRPLINANRHRLSISLPPGPLTVNGDLIRLSQALSNLLNNAAKYTAPGGDLALSVEAVGKEAILRVRDNGLGIAPGDLPMVFDLFAQVNRSLDRTQGGLGIGLTIVQSLIDMHGGRVEAKSEGVGKGSEFVIYLPIRSASAHQETASADRLNAGNHQAGVETFYRVLVVDDNVDSAESLALLLQFAGHQVQTAYDGLSALDIAHTFLPQAVLLDIGLPKMDGYEVARQLRQAPNFAEAVLIALTGYGQAEDRQRSKEAGFDHHLTKPVDYSLLSSIINSLSSQNSAN